MTIIVNGQRFVVDRSTIGYWSVVEFLPLKKYDVRYTVTWKRPDGAAGDPRRGAAGLTSRWHGVQRQPHGAGVSNRNNPKRDEARRTEHGPRWEAKDPGKGCNSTHVARSRTKWKRRRRRLVRRRLKAKEVE